MSEEGSGGPPDGGQQQESNQVYASSVYSFMKSSCDPPPPWMILLLGQDLGVVSYCLDSSLSQIVGGINCVDKCLGSDVLLTVLLAVHRQLQPVDIHLDPLE